MIFRYTSMSYMTRRITEMGGVYVVVEADEPKFPSQLVVPNNDEPALDTTSPREVGPWRLRWRGGFQAPANAIPGPGDRFIHRTVLYEITSPARIVDEGRPGIETYEVRCQLIEELYPVVGELQEMDGTPLFSNVRFSAYRGDESHQDQGTYEDFASEAPIEWQAVLLMNRQIAHASWVYRIVQVELNPIGRYIRMDLRRSGG